MNLWGRNRTRADLEERIGSLSQLGGITRFEYCDGKARGLTVLRVRTASGLEFSVFPDRGLDIFEALYEGKSLCWHSPAGLSHPAYYDPRDNHWLKTFAGGLLTTCGLSTAGSPSVDQGDELGLHGPISTTPAEQVGWSEEWVGDELTLSISGRIRESPVFGPNLVNHRTITTTLAGRSIEIHDCIVNEGYRATPLMVLYHCNFGFPFLTEQARVYCRSSCVESRTELARAYADSWNIFEPPNSGIEERCYYHSIEADEKRNAHVVLVGDEITRSLAIEIIYSSTTLPRLIEWKSVQPRHYVLGLEPSMCRADGRKKEREDGTLRILDPGEKVETALTIRVLVEQTEIASAVEACGAAVNPEHVSNIHHV